ncbi:hypothetical protein [Paenibacillus foliorum]|nr:hypothetical protein [Paenibacillus foliorum]
MSSIRSSSHFKYVVFSYQDKTSGVGEVRKKKQEAVQWNSKREWVWVEER